MNTCRRCGRSLGHLRADAVWCSDSCRKAAQRAASPDKARLKQRAQQAVYEAVKRGDLIRPDACERCGIAANPNLRKPNIEAHHHDYRQPLQVEWLCKRCHALEHRAKVDARRRSRNGRGVRVYLTPEDFAPSGELRVHDLAVARKLDRAFERLMREAA